jgi:hypothetical protein
MGGQLILGTIAAATSSDFESNTNFNYSESAYPTQSIGGYNQQQNPLYLGSGTFSGISGWGIVNQGNQAIYSSQQT